MQTQMNFKNVATIVVFLLIIFVTFGKVSKQLQTFMGGTNLAQVSTAVTVSASISPQTVYPGASATLSWTSTNATSCIIDIGAASNIEQPTSGTYIVTPTKSMTYVVKCVGTNGSDIATVPVVVSPITLNLSASPTSIVSGQSSTLTWSSTDATSCLASGAWTGARELSGTEVVTPATNSSYTLTCGDSITGGSIVKSTTITVTPPPTTTNKFIIGDKIKTSGNVNVRSSAGGSRLGKQVTGAQGTIIGGPTQSTKSSDIYWNIDFVTAPDGWVVETYIVKTAGSPPPPPAPTLTLSATPASITTGDSSTLSWSSTDTTSCTASGAWTGTQATSGTLSVTPTTTSTYTLDCTGAGGNISKSTTVTVNLPPPSTKFNIGDSVQTTSSVNVRDAANGNLLGTQALSATGTILGGGTYAGGYYWWNVDYTNTPDGWTAENYLQLYTAPPTVTLSANPTSITTGGSSTLTWSSTLATSCSAPWATSTATSGTQSVSPTATTTYTIDCTGAGGTTTKSTTVTVSSNAPTLTFSANPTTITSGSSSTLTWNSTNATSCNASGGWTGTKAISGTQLVAPTATTTYNLACTGVGGTVTKSAMVSVGTSGPNVPPTLPLIFQVPMPTQTGKVWSIAAGDSTGFQNALNQAALGDTIELVAGSTYTGAFTFPNKTTGSGWIVVRSSKHTSLPASGLRVNPSDVGNMAKIVSPGSNAIPVKFMPKSHHYRLIGLEVTLPTTITFTQGTIVGISPNSGNAADLPNNITLDRMYVHAQPTNNVQRCLQADGAYIAVVDSYLGDCHAKGFDSQAIVTFNTNGPIKIVNNHLEGAGENIMFGGADPAISGAITSDVEIRNNYIYTPASWGAGMTTKPWTKKNLFETKSVQRILLEGNVFDGSWPDGQIGTAILIKSANQSGNCNWCGASHITIRNNIIRNATNGVGVAGKEGGNPYPAVIVHDVLIENNLFDNIGVAPYNATSGGSLFFGIDNEARNVTLNKNTLRTYANISKFIQFNNVPAAYNLQFTNNIIPFGTYGIFGVNAGGESAFFSQTTGTPVYSGNVVIGSVKSGYPTTQFVPDINTALATGQGANINTVLSATATAVMGGR